MRAESDPRDQQQRQDHQQNAAQKLSARLALGLVKRGLHGLTVETQVLVLAQQINA